MKSGYLRISVSSVGKINHKQKDFASSRLCASFLHSLRKKILLCAGTFPCELFFPFYLCVRCVKKSFVKIRVYSRFLFSVLREMLILPSLQSRRRWRERWRGLRRRRRGCLIFSARTRSARRWRQRAVASRFFPSADSALA